MNEIYHSYLNYIFDISDTSAASGTLDTSAASGTSAVSGTLDTSDVPDAADVLNIYNTQFYKNIIDHLDLHFKLNPDYNLNYDLDYLFKYYETTKKLIIKQYKKSIFYLSIPKLDIKILIDIIIKSNNFDIKSSGIKSSDTYYDICNFNLLNITMNLYSVFRMFIVNWNIDESKKRINLSDKCTGINNSINIVYYAGNLHNIWIINFINNCINYITNEQKLQMNSLLKINNSSLNYVTLDKENYTLLKEFLFGLNLNSILELNLHTNKEIPKDKVETELYSFSLIIKCFKYGMLELNDPNKRISPSSLINKSNKIIEYIISINKLLDNPSNDLSDISANKLILENLSSYIDKINEYIKLDINIYINRYFLLLINIINNINILIYFYINKTLYLEGKIDDLNKIYYSDVITFDKLLELYNSNVNLNLNLNYIISNPVIVLQELKTISKDDKLMLLNNLNNLIKSDIDIYLNNLFNDIKVKDLDTSLSDIIKKLELLQKLSDNIILLTENYKDTYFKYYFINLNLFVNNIILILCFYHSKIYKELPCKDKDLDIDEIEIDKYFKIGINISKLIS